MMKNMYVIKDIVSGEAASPIINADNDEVIIRELSDCRLTEVMEKHPNDFDILCVGLFDTKSCDVTPSPRFVAHLGALRDGKAK